MYKRYIEKNMKEALSDTPVVFLMGPRQSGKTTLVQEIINSSWSYLTFDDVAQLELAMADPIGFIRSIESQSVAIDEVQRFPELFVSIKQSVDENRQAGRFLLTGSANALLLPQLSDSLAGRIEAIQLTTLSECEIKQVEPTFLKFVLAGVPPKTKQVRIREYLLDRLVMGCYPEPLQRVNAKRAAVWYQQYVQSLIQRDLKDLINTDSPDSISKLMKLLAFYSSKLINYSEIGSKIGLSHNTVKKYISLLSRLFIVDQLPAWHKNEHKRLIKTPKVHLTDVGILTALRGLTKERLSLNPNELGRATETFVYNEIKKQANFLDENLQFSHYRTKDKVEVDIIIENSIGEYIAIEVKASATVRKDDFKGLQHFQNDAGDRFIMGILLYDGDHTTAFGKNLFAAPLATLWS